MKKKWMKVTTTLLLCLTLAVGSVYVAYKTPETVEAVAIVDDAILIMLALFAACGVAPSYDHLTDGDNAQRLQDAIQQAYDQIRNQQIASGGDGQEDPDNDEDPDNTPTWKKLLEDVKEAGHVRLTKFLGATGAWRILKKLADSQFFNFIKPSPDIGYNTTVPVTFGLDGLSDANIDLSLGYNTFGSSNPDYLAKYQESYDNSTLAMSSYGFESTKYPNYFWVSCDPYGATSIILVPFISSSSLYSIYKYNPETGGTSYFISSGYDKQFSSGLTHEDGKYSRFMRRDGQYCFSPNIDIYLAQDSQSTRDAQLIYGQGTNKDLIWVHPDIQDSFKNESDLELYPPTDPYNIPDVQALQALQQAMNNAKAETDPEAKTQAQNQALYDYFNKLGLQNSPVTDPVVNPKPNPGTNPDVTPTPPPDQPDDPGNDAYTADLKTLFPFCIPFDLVHAFQLLDAEPQAPVFTIPFHIEFRGKVLADEKWTVDFKDYESVVKIFRILETLGFCVALILATRSLIKG